MKLADHKKTVKIPLRQATLCFLIRGNEVLLARKKRGFAEGKINGVGGKVNDRESVEEAAIRETREEIDVDIKILVKVAELDFYFSHNPDWNQKVIVFEVREWEGEPKESEEMDPSWYSFDKIPYDSMWVDDILWLPNVLEGKKLNAELLFNEKEEIIDYLIEEI